MMVSQVVMGWMDSLAFLVLRVMASKALREMQVPLACPEPRAFQEKWVLQDRAYQARKASVVSLEMLDFQVLQVTLVLQVLQEPQDNWIVTQV